MPDSHQQLALPHRSSAYILEGRGNHVVREKDIEPTRLTVLCRSHEVKTVQLRNSLNTPNLPTSNERSGFGALMYPGRRHIYFQFCSEFFGGCPAASHDLSNMSGSVDQQAHTTCKVFSRWTEEKHVLRMGVLPRSAPMACKSLQTCTFFGFPSRFVLSSLRKPPPAHLIRSVGYYPSRIIPDHSRLWIVKIYAKPAFHLGARRS